VTDADGDFGSDTLMVTVNNVPPTVDVGPDAAIDEGDTFTRTGWFTDPGTGDTWTATVDYGDGSGEQPLTLNADKTFDLNRLYSSQGVYTVTVTVTDDDGGVGSDTATVTVNPAGQVLTQCIFDLTARPKSGKVQIVWTHQSDAASYNIYRSTTADVEINPANRIAAGHATTYATYLDLDVVNNTTYYYKVVKVVGGSENCYSNEAGATPVARTRTR